MPEINDTERQIVSTLKTLLLLRPSDAQAHRTMVLTTLPRAWRSEVVKNPLVVDLSKLLGVGSGASGRSERTIIEEIVVSLMERGWDRNRVFTEYRSDFRSRRIIDIAVLDANERLHLAVEVKRPERMSEQGVEAAFAQLSTSDAIWHCVTDGEQFHLKLVATGETRVSDQTPSPFDVGLSQAGGDKPKPPSIHPEVCIPVTIDELQAAVVRHQPEGIILDQNMPFGASAERSALGRSVAPPLGELLPDDLPAIRGRVEALPIFMAWAASIPSVRTLSGVVPSSLMTANAYEWLRRYLLDRMRLCGVVELPPDLFRPLALTATLFYLGGTRDEVYFDVLASRGDLLNIESRPWFDSLLKWMMGKGPTTGYAVNSNALRVWAAGPNNPEIERIYERLGRLGQLIPLGELCEVRRGFHVRGDAEADRGVPYLQGRNIRDGHVNLEDARKVQAEGVPEWAYLKSGDLLMSEVSTERSLVVLNQGSEPAILSQNVIVLRPQADRVLAEYLVEYLNSSTAQKLILANASRLGGLHRISHSFLRELKVPIVEPELFEGFNEIKEVESELQAKAEELESTRRCLFDSDNGQVFRDRIGNLKRGGKLLATSMRSAGRLEFQIANFYPFPVAYSFRLLASIVNPAELYKEQLRVGENMLAFIASVSLSLLQKRDLAEAGIDLRDYWQGGISPGDWKAITARCSKIFASYKDVPLTSAIQRLNIGSEKKGFGVTAKLLVERLNDFKHHRGPVVEEDYVRASIEVGEALVDGMERISFFTEYPIRQVQVFREASEQCGITYGQQTAGGWTVHDLRHTCLTHLLQEGTDLATVRDFAGHHSIQETTKYVHPTAASRQRAATASSTLVTLASQGSALKPAIANSESAKRAKGRKLRRAK